MMERSGQVLSDAEKLVAVANDLERTEIKAPATGQVVGLTQQTVGEWRARYIKHRLDGLLDAPRAGAPRTIDDARVDAVITRTLESIPEGATHWSTRSMARQAGFSQTAISRIWHAFGLQSHRQETEAYTITRMEMRSRK